MARSATLELHNITAGDIYTTAIVDLDIEALSITGIHLELRASIIKGVDEVSPPFWDILFSPTFHLPLTQQPLHLQLGLF